MRCAELADLSAPLATLPAMGIYKPNERPGVEVLVEGTSHRSHLRGDLATQRQGGLQRLVAVTARYDTPPYGAGRSREDRRLAAELTATAGALSGLPCQSALTCR
jgi:hypothetical protein